MATSIFCFYSSFPAEFVYLGGVLRKIGEIGKRLNLIILRKSKITTCIIIIIVSRIIAIIIQIVILIILLIIGKYRRKSKKYK